MLESEKKNAFLGSQSGIRVQQIVHGTELVFGGGNDRLGRLYVF